MVKQNNITPVQDDGIDKEPRSNFPLTKINFIMMAVSGLIILAGFLLMLGGSIFSTRRIVVGPTMAFIGFIFMGVAVVYRPKNKDKA